MLKHKLSSAFSNVALAGVLLFSAGYASAVVNSTQSRLVFNGDKTTQTLTVVNSDRLPALVQLWTDDSDPLSSPDRIATPLIVVPPVFKLAASESRTLRVMLLSREGLPKDRERLYWMNIYQIPPNTQLDNPQDKKVILPLRIRLKVFVRPEGMPEPAENIGDSLLFTLKDRGSQNQALEVKNPTPYYMTLGAISLGGTALSPTMISPKSSTTIAAPQIKNTGQLEWSTIDDYGKAVSHKRQL